MDKNFLELWGNFLISIARGQRQMEEMGKWMGLDPGRFPDMTAWMGAFSAPGASGKADAETDAASSWAATSEDLMNTYGQFLEFMGLVAKPEHLRVVRKYEALKEKAAEREETIRHLRMLLDERNGDQGRVVSTFQEMMRRQSEKFQELMREMGQHCDAVVPPPAEGGETGKKE